MRRKDENVRQTEKVSGYNDCFLRYLIPLFQLQRLYTLDEMYAQLITLKV
jgi:hypothetical protein